MIFDRDHIVFINVVVNNILFHATSNAVGQQLAEGLDSLPTRKAE